MTQLTSASQAEDLTFYYEKIWKDVNSNLTTHYGEDVHRNWFSKLNLLEVQGDSVVVLVVSSDFVRDWIKSNHHDIITNLWMHYDSRITRVDIVTQDNKISSNSVSHQELSNVQDITQDFSFDSNNILKSSLDSRFTFDNFVVGSSNELAYTAALAVAESDKAIIKSNPLFLYGDVGLGKTHLMHAIAWHCHTKNPNRKVLYMSAEKFMYRFIKALRNKDVMSFKDEFRSVDVLMIDDIQFICGKENTQEEFFHTFNAIIDNNKQMVISCDRSPSDLDNIEDRIKSRLGWGLVADVHSTTYELRLGILESKLERMNINISKNIIDFLASKIISNVRELEGALNKVIAHSNLMGREITLETTQDILRDLLRSSARTVTIEEIKKTVANRYNIKISEMSSSRRMRSIARPRQIAMYLSKNLTPTSLSAIGENFGKKDHTTVMHAVKTVSNLIRNEKDFYEEINLLTKMLQG